MSTPQSPAPPPPSTQRPRPLRRLLQAVLRAVFGLLFSTDATLTRERLQQAARAGGLPEIAVPRSVLHLDPLPRLGTGKIDYAALRSRAPGA